MCCSGPPRMMMSRASASSSLFFFPSLSFPLKMMQNTLLLQLLSLFVCVVGVLTCEVVFIIFVFIQTCLFVSLCGQKYADAWCDCCTFHFITVGINVLLDSGCVSEVGQWCRMIHPGWLSSILMQENVFESHVETGFLNVATKLKGHYYVIYQCLLQQ